MSSETIFKEPCARFFLTFIEICTIDDITKKKEDVEYVTSIIIILMATLLFENDNL